MRYVKVLKVSLGTELFPQAREIFARYGIDVQLQDGWLIEVSFEKSDSRLHEVQRALKDAVDREGGIDHKAVFEPWELEEAEAVLLRVFGFCGDAFDTWCQELGLPPGTRVMDKRDMGKRDLARTFAWKEIVISERLKEILTVEQLTGWTADPIQHVKPAKDRFAPMYQLGSSNLLPPLAPETEIEVIERPAKPTLIERGPLHYRRRDLATMQDINWTAEVFLDPGVSHRYLIVSQRTRRALNAHRVRGDFELEPVVILE